MEGCEGNIVKASHWLKYFFWHLENVILPAEALQCVLQRERAVREKERGCVCEKESKRAREREREMGGWAGKTSHMHKEGARGTERESV